ncbi:hypothetical protein D3C71_1509610 [compost metagenome]
MYKRDDNEINGMRITTWWYFLADKSVFGEYRATFLYKKFINVCFYAFHINLWSDSIYSYFNDAAC